MKTNKIRKLFIKNLPRQYSIDKLVQLIKKKTHCSPNLEILQNKKNPNNGLAILTPLSKANEIRMKQQLSNKFSFCKRTITVTEYEPREKNKNKNKKKKKKKKNSYLANNELKEKEKEEQKNNSQYHKRDLSSKKNFFSHNKEIAKNTVFMCNLPYRAKLTEIKNLLKKISQFKDIELYYDSYKRFKGSAKITLTNKNAYLNLLKHSGKLSLHNRRIFIKKFFNLKEKTKNSENPTQDQHQNNTHKSYNNKENEWFQKEFLNKNNTKSSTFYKPNYQKNDKTQLKNLKISNNQIIIFNLPKNINEKKLFNLFKEFKPEEKNIKIIKKKKRNYSFITFQTKELREKSLKLNGMRVNRNKLIIKRAFEKNISKKESKEKLNNQKSTEYYEKIILDLKNQNKKLQLIIENKQKTIKKLQNDIEKNISNNKNENNDKEIEIEIEKDDNEIDKKEINLKHNKKKTKKIRKNL
ncbi:RNA recognition motif rrm domain containing protein [Anaeramoeba flamelloides]|uniref:RNA recognition motif rrm domain containing protein n=1 Tax=Anaeramoeba flamelloides TaxID=1746091 RepID=A0AAV7YWY3_9EUKA|nr:RNA recognition motif rrm domain containing protein [Anaeramoeba flamelloides]